ncbi:MAG TPA: hypothetical protein VLE73_04040 [Candidatus Saccharimonadales bacterium]|nr:hypothetical protein [Candidatus Saccharimonadales bacterium]
MDRRRFKWGIAAAGFGMAAMVAAFSFMSLRAGAAPVVFVVDDDGMATGNNCNSSTPTPYTTISAAVTAAAAGDTVKVCPGSYTEDVTIDKSLTLKGAKAGTSVNGRTFNAANESTVTGLVTIDAEDVTVDGFSLTNPDQGLGVLVKTTGKDAVIRKNILQTVGNNTFAGPVVGIYLELGPDGVSVRGNKISDIQSQTGSAQGVLVGDSTSADPSLDTSINNNRISDITSVEKGAYGVQVNNGSSSAPTAVGYTEVEVAGNTIKNLSGTWVHAIGLEGETPNADVNHNVISNLTDTDGGTVNDAVGVFFEDNPFFFTSQVNQNNLAVGSDNFGIAVATALSTQYVSLSVDGECNWWGAANGPSTVGTGSGAMVGPNVDFKPWLKSANLDRGCGDHNHHDSDKHHGDWGDDNDDWRED